MMFATDLLEPPRAPLALDWGGPVRRDCARGLHRLSAEAVAGDDAAASPVVVEMLPAATATPVDSPDVARGPLMEEAMLTPRHGATFDLELPIQFRIR
jgi:hypothetical protein